MIKWFKRNQKSGASEEPEQQNIPVNDDEEKILESNIEPAVQEPEPAKEGLFARFKRGLSKTRHQLGDGIGRLLLGKKEISPELIEELETLLISADLGIDTTQAVLKQLTDGLERKKLSDGDTVYQALKHHLQQIVGQEKQPFVPETEDHSPFVILMVGVNGAGKTTTIGKLAKQFQQQGKKVMLAAGDTFRAAAVEQLHVWGERNDIPVIAQHTGADSASVIFDALQAAKARKIDVLIADTAGRLHTQSNLMEELKKVKRVLQKIDPKAPHETMLVLDASIGQNALNQARQFHEAVQLTGITMTKLDGTAKGGILFAIANDLGIPFRYLGVGEGIEDLRPFDAAQFVGAIFNDDHI
ncbi:signal recognition particle-docking protein FtsY [uncultured Legionella sp.]|uniref:signal recognition particle-docking protein FtsY n=1 Tax=uncultured Legionella sp. TaxID=210934 RepID=UPI002635C181|nr:signal recognition particle-docking protein FtsY [uncultured Legionella sp.]